MRISKADSSNYFIRDGWRHSTIILLALFAASCASTTAQQVSQGSSGPATWEIDNVVSKCLVSVAGGALVGGLLGAAIGGRNSSVGTGALVGAAAGGALCAVISALDEQDRARIRAAQLEAARTGKPQVMSYQGQDGLERQVAVRVTDISAAAKPRSTASKQQPAQSEAQVAAASGQRICRTLNTSVTVQSKGQADVPSQLVCRTPEGDYEPA
jgi:outer membrane lipoprotein SlyB